MAPARQPSTSPQRKTKRSNSVPSNRSPVRKQARYHGFNRITRRRSASEVTIRPTSDRPTSERTPLLAERQPSKVVQLQKWLQSTSYPIPERYTSTGGQWFHISPEPYTAPILLKRDNIPRDHLVLHEIAASGMPPSLARLDHTGYEHHIFSLRWPHRSYPPKNPKLDSLMKDIDAQHYALLIVYFTTEPGPLSLHGRTIELSLQDTSPKALLDDPDGKAVQVDLEHDWEDTFRNYHDGDARRCHVKYVATVQYPFEKEEWRSLEEIAMKILRRAGGLYNCERFHCQTFCENVSGEVYALAQRKKEVDEKKRDRCHVM